MTKRYQRGNQKPNIEEEQTTQWTKDTKEERRRPLWYLLVIVLSVRLLCTASDYLFGIFWSLCCLFVFYVRLLITSLVSFGHCVVCSSSMYGFWLPLWYLLVIVLSVLLLCTASDYLFGIFWPLCCLFFFYVRLLITSLVSFGHCVVCSSFMYGFR
jgi:hypothetical protein